MSDKSRAYLYGTIARILFRPSTPKIYNESDVDKLNYLRFFGPKPI
jgi:hypothetical protein